MFFFPKVFVFSVFIRLLVEELQLRLRGFLPVLSLTLRKLLVALADTANHITHLRELV